MLGLWHLISTNILTGWAGLFALWPKRDVEGMLCCPMMCISSMVHWTFCSYFYFLIIQAETLVDNIKFDHGYTAKSPAIINVSPVLNLHFNPGVFRFYIFIVYGFFFPVIGDHGRVHSRTAARILSVRHRGSKASTWRSSCSKPKADNRSEGMLNTSNWMI